MLPWGPLDSGGLAARVGDDPGNLDIFYATWLEPSLKKWRVAVRAAREIWSSKKTIQSPTVVFVDLSVFLPAGI